MTVFSIPEARYPIPDYMSTDSEISDAIQSAIAANPEGVVEEEHKGRRSKQASINELLRAQGVLDARALRTSGRRLFSAVRFRRPQ